MKPDAFGIPPQTRSQNRYSTPFVIEITVQAGWKVYTLPGINTGGSRLWHGNQRVAGGKRQFIHLMEI
ncbi:TPA: hypothetical protein PP061_002772 [Salmonella bongori]|uniref:hypothetical protein n=1 Tax=Salmonella bongori TaxID=54736 RepID=UPI0014826C6C|nr:hypothetical protein [Salmonella bongori]HDJ2746778.1 hypothetical protein [Salmonella bongori]HDJ2764716.1 hypothetical protein [Salmonella bongori]